MLQYIRVMLTSVDKFSPEAIALFMKTKQSDVIPVKVQRMILQLDRANSLLRVKFSITRAAHELMKEFPELAYSSARERIADAINYFHHNIKVSNQAWNQLYADRFDELAHKCEMRGDMMEARRNRIKAHELRTKDNENIIDIDGLEPIKVMISPDVTPERLGLEEQNLKLLWKETTVMIKKMDLNKEEKNTLIREAGMSMGTDPEDVEFEELD